MKSFYAAVSAIIVNDEKKILLVSPDGKTHWQTISGWIENETLDRAVTREISEELKLDDVKVIDVIDSHALTFPSGLTRLTMTSEPWRPPCPKFGNFRMQKQNSARLLMTH